MKKNLISIVILALLIVNIVLTAIMMFSVVGTSRKTAALVDNIATALNLELAANGNGEEDEAVSVPMADIATYDVAGGEKMTIQLKSNDDEQHFCIVSVTLSMNTKDKTYKKFGETLSERDTLIKGEIFDVFGQYTVEEAKNNQEEIKDKILERIQTMFDSEFIFNVVFNDIMIQ